MRRSAIITINPDIIDREIDLKTGDISTIEILDSCKTLMALLSKQLMDEYCNDRNIQSRDDIDMQDFEGYVLFFKKPKTWMT